MSTKQRIFELMRSEPTIKGLAIAARIGCNLDYANQCACEFRAGHDYNPPGPKKLTAKRKHHRTATGYCAYITYENGQTHECGKPSGHRTYCRDCARRVSVQPSGSRYGWNRHSSTPA